MKPESAVKAFYNKFPYPAHSINSLKDLHKLPFQNKLLEILKRCLDNGSVLDAGCGTGELTLLFADQGFESFGIDTSVKSLKIARNSTKELSIPATFKIMDVLKIKFPTNSFDAAIANGVLHHTRNPYLGFRNLLRVTKPKGLIVVVVYNKLGSFPRRLLGGLSRLFGGSSIDSRIKFIKRVLPRSYQNKPDAVIADAFFNPYETAFTIQEILDWFEKNKVKYLDSFPSIKLGRYLGYILVEIYWMLTLKGNVFVMVGQKTKS